MNKNALRGILVLLWVTAACRPVIAIGWGEFLFLSLLILILLGLPLLKFIRRTGGSRKREKKDK